MTAFWKAFNALFGAICDVGEIFIAEGLAVPFNCGATRCPPTPKPWCNVCL